MTISRNTTILVAAALVISACATKRKTSAELPPAPPAAGAGLGEAAEGSDAGAVGTSAVAGSQADLTAQTGADHVLFATDASDLDDEARTILTAHARWFAANPSVRAAI